MPENERCKKLFIESGLFDDVTTQSLEAKSKSIIYSLESGRKTEPKIAKEVIDYSLRQLGEEQSTKTRKVYRIIMEMMGNTRQHAYELDEEINRWNLIAFNDDGKIRFAFMDDGYGIPSTIRKTPFEKFKKILTSKIDVDLVESALKGEFRTRTEEGYRGKGLPSIYNCYKEGYIGNLRIVSNKAFYDKGAAKTIESNFRGTLYTWNFV